MRFVIFVTNLFNGRLCSWFLLVAILSEVGRRKGQAIVRTVEVFRGGGCVLITPYTTVLLPCTSTRSSR